MRILILGHNGKIGKRVYGFLKKNKNVELSVYSGNVNDSNLLKDFIENQKEISVII